MRLDERDYADFKVSDLFTVKYGVNIELNACDECGPCDEDGVNFVARTAENNGVSSRVSAIDGIIPQNAGLISVAGGGSSVLSAFLQTEPFYSGRDLYTLEAKDKISDEAKLFAITVIEQNRYRYSFGRQANKTLPDLELKLPVISDGTPDWQFMEEYIKSLNYKPLTTKNMAGRTFALDTTGWKFFHVGRLFSMQNGVGITQDEISENEGSFAAVQSGEDNNGVMGRIDLGYCKAMGYTYSEKPCLTVARSGSAGFVSFQAEGCVVGDSAKLLSVKNDDVSTGVYLFLQAVLTANRYKYTYGRKVTEAKYLNDWIKLPAKRKEDGSYVYDPACTYSDDGYIPDWNFMECYMRALPYGDRI